MSKKNRKQNQPKQTITFADLLAQMQAEETAVETKPEETPVATVETSVEEAVAETPVAPVAPTTVWFKKNSVETPIVARPFANPIKVKPIDELGLTPEFIKALLKPRAVAVVGDVLDDVQFASVNYARKGLTNLVKESALEGEFVAENGVWMLYVNENSMNWKENEAKLRAMTRERGDRGVRGMGEFNTNDY